MAETQPAPAAISIDDFRRIELRTAKILTADDVAGADRLWRLTIDVGGGITKEIVAGVKAHYSKESLVGKTVVVVNNLQPSVIRGVTSNGMLLAAKNTERLTFLTTEHDMPPGTLIG